MDKKTIRTLISSRKINNKAHLDDLINQRLINYLSEFYKIGLFMPRYDEIDIMPTIMTYKERVYLPVIKGNTLIFKKYDGNMKLNKYNIEEPNNNKIINIKDLDVVIVPLIAYDLEFNRVGKGKGFYDSILDDVKLKIGLGYSFQCVNNIDINEYDIKLDGIINEVEMLCIY